MLRADCGGHGSIAFFFSYNLNLGFQMSIEQGCEVVAIVLLLTPSLKLHKLELISNKLNAVFLEEDGDNTVSSQTIT